MKMSFSLRILRPIKWLFWIRCRIAMKFLGALDFSRWTNSGPKNVCSNFRKAKKVDLAHFDKSQISWNFKMRSWLRLSSDFDNSKSNDTIFTRSSNFSIPIQVMNFLFQGWAKIWCLQLPLFFRFARANHDKDPRHPIFATLILKRPCTESLFWTTL